MAQGLLKGSKRKKSVASTRKITQRKLVKGRKTFQAKGRKLALERQDQTTSREICKKNEKNISARAMQAGNTFFLSDIKDKGKKELSRMKRNQVRGERKNDLGTRLKDQLKKMGTKD